MKGGSFRWLAVTGAADAGPTAVSFGELHYWLHLHLPMEQTLRLYRERLKAEAYVAPPPPLLWCCRAWVTGSCGT